MRFNDALMCVDTGNALTMCRPKCLMKLRNGNLARQSLFWLGHLARMDARRLPKQAAFGFWKGHMIRERPILRQGQWFKHLLAQIQVSQLDWFRVAQGRVAWEKGGRVGVSHGLSLTQ